LSSLIYVINFYNLQEDENKKTVVADCLATVFYSFIGLDIPLDPNRISHRILVISTCLTGGLLFWSYSAGLVSFLTIEKFDYPVKSFAVSCKPIFNRYY
jgi:hypothetical protein